MKHLLFSIYLIFFSVSVQAQFEIIGGDRSVCSGSRVVLRASTGAQYTNYKWYYEGISVDIGSKDSIDNLNLNQGGNSIVVTAMENNTDLVGDTVNIFQFRSPQPVLNHQNFLQCKGDSVLAEDISTATGSYTYTWSNGKTGKSVYLKQEGLYILTKRGPFPSNCSGKDTVEINLQLLPEYDITGRTTVCEGDPISLNADLTSAPEGVISYVWKNDLNETISTESSLNTTAENTTDYKLILTEVAALTCSDSGDVTVNVNPAINAETLNDTSICSGDELAVTGPDATGGNGGPYSYSWTSGSDGNLGNGKTISFTPSAESTISLTISDANSCTFNTDFEVELRNPEVSISEADSLFICQEDSLLLQPEVSGAEEPYTFLWTLPDNTTSEENELLIKTEFGTYALQITDEYACSASDTVQIESAMGIRPVFTNIDGPTEITYLETAQYTISAQTENFELEVTTEGLGETEITGQSFVYTPLEEIEEVNFEINISNQCGSDDSVFVLNVTEPVFEENILFIPNTVILSDANPESRVFKVYSETVQDENFELKVFSVKGDLVFEEDNYSALRAKGWRPDPGTLGFNGANTFTYLTKGIFDDGKTFEEKGTVTVIK